MKNVWTLILLTFYLRTTNSLLRCNKKDNCLCIPGQDQFEFQCPKDYPDHNEGMVIHLSEGKEIGIDCSGKADKFDLTLLPNVTLDKINNVRIRFCPLPENNLKQILNRLSVSEVNFLQFGSSDLNVVLTKKYFEGLNDLNVKRIQLNANNLSDFEEDVFSELPNLSSLDLQSNKIEFLKPGLFKDTPLLTDLDVAGNNLRKLPKGLFASLEKLKVLHLWSNKLTKLDENSFEGLLNLESLELSVNLIEEIAEDIFHNLTNLVQINLSQNRLKNVSSRLFINNKKLKLIKWMYNDVSLPDYLFAKLPVLEDVYLNDCKLTSLGEHIFENSSNLRTVTLRKNNLAYLSENLFRGFPKLEKIDFSYNKIEDIGNVFATLKSLKELYLQNNLISEIRRDAFSDLTNLIQIDLSKNRIKKIHYYVFENKNSLTKINLSHNQISKKDKFPIFEQVYHLEELDLSYNFITQVSDVLIRENKVNLTNVNLSHNQITDIRVADFQPFAINKFVVDFSNNNISIVDFSYSEMVSKGVRDARSNNDFRQTVIHLNNNPLNCDCNNYDLLRYFTDKIAPEVQSFFDIRAENLTCNNPPELKTIPFENLHPSLLICRFDYTHSCEHSWRPFDKSMIIDCSGQNLSEFPQLSQNLSSIIPFTQTELRLEHNNLTFGPFSNFTGYANVTKLFLAHNNIREVSWLPPKLKEISLDNNKIKRLNYEVLNMFNNSNVTHFTLYNNPWKCDCEAENLTNFLRQHSRQVDTSFVYCANSTIRLVDLNKHNLCTEWEIVYTIVLVLTILLFVAVCFVIYYRYKQELKIWLYAKNLCLWWVTEEELDKDKIYDAFVSYSHKDEDFVAQNLVPVLESGVKPYKLCLHQRDWIPGEFITKQITNSVIESRRTIVILSESFLESVWGKMEFRTAHTQAMTDGRTRVIIVLLGDLNVDALDAELKSYLKTNTYVKWGDPYFWNKLKYALPHSKRCVSSLNQKHANVMNCIDDKFNLVAPVTTSPGSTPPVLSLDAALLKKHPLNFVASPRMDTPPAEAGLLTSSNL